MPMKLIPYAKNMTSLLAALKDQPFHQMPEGSVASNGTGSDGGVGNIERPTSLSALMTILAEQAEQDGFKLITINTEQKRIIMACNRQGRPPEGSPVVSENGDGSSPASKRNGRAGTSIRCGCRMRVNINYHSKLNAWRITSFEAVHNHEYGSSIVLEQSEQKASEVCDYQITQEQIDNAIKQFCETKKSKVSIDEDDAALLLTSLSLPSSVVNNSKSGENVRSLSEGAEGLKKESSSRSSAFTEKKPPVSSLKLDTLLNKENDDSGYSSPREHALHENNSRGRLRFLLNGREMHSPNGGYGSLRSAPINDRILHLNSEGIYQDSKQHHQQSLPSLHPASFRSDSSTAIEIDRYAMLHSSFKKVIAMACKKREWTEETLGIIGKLKSSFTGLSPSSALPSPMVPRSNQPSYGNAAPKSACIVDMTKKRNADAVNLAAYMNTFKKPRFQYGMSVSKPEHTKQSIVYEEKLAARRASETSPSPANDTAEKEKLLEEIRMKYKNSPSPVEEVEKEEASKKLNDMDKIRLFGDKKEQKDSSLLESLWKSKERKDDHQMDIDSNHKTSTRKASISAERPSMAI
ncbi:hypothetical protein MP638_003138 [Amoeboaphelidium occidentale]|nr:hypothetical protein MP638_003138 [Amoeboaphelidium occidentale]